MNALHVCLFSAVLVAMPTLATAAEDVRGQGHHHHQRDSGDGHRQHGAHVHGEGVLTLVQEGQSVLVEMTTPAYNLLGFEHAPRSQAQQDALDDTLQALERLDKLVTLPDACHQLASTIDMPDWSQAGEHRHEHHQHGDFVARFELDCSHPLDIHSLRFPLFGRYPAFERIRVQWLLDTGQGASTVTAAQSRVR